MKTDLKFNKFETRPKRVNKIFLLATDYYGDYKKSLLKGAFKNEDLNFVYK